MALEDVLERSTIALPRVLTLKEAEKLLHYLAVNLPADIHYQATYSSTFRGHHETKKTVKDEGSVSISGSIKRRDKDLAFDSFRLLPSDDLTRISHLRFELIPGYELREYRPEVITLWDDVRVSVQKYFEAASPKNQS